MAQGRSNKKKRDRGGTSKPPNDPDAHTESIRERLKLLDLRIESLQRDLVGLTVSRRHVALARSQYRTRLDLELVNRKSGKKRKAD